VEQRFSERVALVTGAASGIGRAVTMSLAAEGAHVVALDVRMDLAQVVVDEVTASGGDAIAVAGDVGLADTLKRAVDAAVTRYGALHLAFNNAGMIGPVGLLADITIEEYQRVIDVNLNSVFYGMYYEIPEMLKVGGGAIVNTSSIMGLIATASAVPYVTAKHGVAGMTKAAALGYANRGVRINSVHPGYVDTPLVNGWPPEILDYLKSLTPMGRLGTADEVAKYVLFLLSDDASYVTGSQAVLDGAYTAQ
jgi:NAD(P)-dependent dehydrogenase (short-subunit alcohol dehydrogenase family)